MRIAKKLILLTLGLTSVIIGIVGTILPILPGLPFLIVGIVLISKSSKRFENYKPLKTALVKLREGRDVAVKNLPNRIGKYISLL